MRVNWTGAWPPCDPYTTKPKAEKGGTLLVEVINFDHQESRLLVHSGVKDYVWNLGDSLEWLWAFPHSIGKINEKNTTNSPEKAGLLRAQNLQEWLFGFPSYIKNLGLSVSFTKFTMATQQVMPRDQLWPAPSGKCLYHQPHPLPRGLNLSVWWEWGTF